MTIPDFAKHLIEKHNLAENSYISYNPYQKRRQLDSTKEETEPYFQQSNDAIEKFLTEEKWNRVEEGWYGHDLCGAHPKWLEALEEFWPELEKDSPEFKVLNLKTKWGGIRFYASNISRAAQNAIDELESLLGE